MPQAVAHILLPLILASIIRDFYIKKKDRKNFPLHYVLIVGLAGILPDIDVVAFWFLHFFGFNLGEVHRTFSHTIFVPIVFIILGLLFTGRSFSTLRKHKLKINIVFYCFAIGSLFHLILDGVFVGYVAPLYPFITTPIGLNMFGYLPKILNEIAPASLDAGLLIIYLAYLELKHKISDFI